MSERRERGGGAPVKDLVSRRLFGRGTGTGVAWIFPDFTALRWPVSSITFSRMRHLTKQEQLVLCAIIGLLLVGWAVKTWRLAQSPPVVGAQVEE